MKQLFLRFLGTETRYIHFIRLRIPCLNLSVGSTAFSKHIVLNFYDEMASASAESASSILQKHFPTEFKSKI